jgi:uncharacterized protein (TIGR02646 family)
MKKASKDFDNPPAILINATRRRHLRTAIANQSARHISNKHYSPALVKKKLKAIYNSKCSYCESTVEQVASLQVEHYRPKNAVTDDPAHPGYYWLALEWSNLVLSCPACNGQGAKGNRFPIAGDRVMVQNPFDPNGNLLAQTLRANLAPLLDEHPVLLHPEIDNPGAHLNFTAFGLLEGTTGRGRESICICQLNRDSLIDARQKIINDFLTQCNIIFFFKLNRGWDDELVDEMLKAQLTLLKAHRDDTGKPYTSYLAYLLDNPEICILPRIEPLFPTDFRRAFDQFKQEEPG